MNRAEDILTGCIFGAAVGAVLAIGAIRSDQGAELTRAYEAGKAQAMSEMACWGGWHSNGKVDPLKGGM